MTGLAAQIAEGYRLSICLQPDHATLETDGPEYNEALSLPYVFVEQDGVTGATHQTHFIKDPARYFQTVGFAYTNTLPFYTILYPGQARPQAGEIDIKLMSQSHYREHRMTARPPGRLILDVTNTADGVHIADHGLRQSILSACHHYIVIRLDETRIWSLPVDVGYDFLDGAAAEFRTHCIPVSSHCVNPKGFADTLVEANPQVAAQMKDPLFAFERTMPMTTTHLRVRATGEYFDTEGELTESPQRFLSARVYEFP